MFHNLGRKIQLACVGLVMLLVATFVLMTLVEDVKVYAQYTFHICEENKTEGILDFDRENRLIYSTCIFCGKRCDSYSPSQVTPISTSDPDCEGNYIVVENWEYMAGGYFITQNLRFYENTGTGTNHVNVVETKPALAPTCTTDGHTAELTCMDCQKVIQPSTTLSMTHDTYTTGSITPTCQNQGYSGDTYCHHCDYFVAGEVLPLTNHDTYLTGRVEPTCYTVGYSGDTRCHHCNYIEYGTQLPIGNHDLYQSHPGRNPTCMQPGHTEIYSCRNCTHEEGGTSIPTVEHSYFKNMWGNYECAWCGRIKN